MRKRGETNATLVVARRRDLLQEAARARLVSRARKARRSRVGARKRVARALLKIGYLLLDAGHTLDTETWRPV